jgi:hypothetical protein
VVSYYQDNSASTTEFGFLETYEEDPKKETFNRKSQLYLANTIRHTSSLQQDNFIFTSIVTNEGVGSSLKLTLAYKGTLSTKALNIDDYNFLTKAHVFIDDKTPNSNDDTDTSFRLIIIAYSDIDQYLTAYKVKVIVKQNSEVVPIENSWFVDVDELTQSTNPVYKIKEYDFVSKKATGIINFYVITTGNSPQVGRMTYSKTTGDFTNDSPLKTITFSDNDKNDSQVYGVGCSKIDLDAEEGLDRCAFSTFGAVVYYAEMNNKDEDPIKPSSSSSSIDPTSSSSDEPIPTSSSMADFDFDPRVAHAPLKQQPQPKVTMSRVLRLRRINKNFGKKVFIVANFVVLETERLTTQSQVALIWDVDDYKDGLTGDLGTMQVISLTQNSSVESVFDSVIISATISGG